MNFERNKVPVLRQRLQEPPQFIIVVTGPRQVGKTTMVRQALVDYSFTYIATDQSLLEPEDSFALGGDSPLPFRPIPGAAPDTEWLVSQWQRARNRARTLEEGKSHILAIDEVQKIPRWSEVIKGLWDADRVEGVPLHIVLLGSSPWLMQKGLTESLAGRYERLSVTHWSYEEMQEAFDFSLEEYIYFGGYPGCAGMIKDQQRWKNYIRGALIHPNIEKDILQMTRVDKPALLKTLFELGCGAYSGQIVTYRNLRIQLEGAGNEVTVAHYLDLLSQAELLTGLQKYSGSKLRQRASPPKLNALNTALVSALAGYTFEEAKRDRSFWGRLVESAVGAHLINSSYDNCKVHYWRESPVEVDFVLSRGKDLVAIEVKSGQNYPKPRGLKVFSEKFKEAKTMIVGEGGISLATFLSTPTNDWLER